ncbi:MAG: hypothetical protein HND47_18975 [Chloroflexi bacterium]|nr:hypothetical protein [Chloroflexota bacterium]
MQNDQNFSDDDGQEIDVEAFLQAMLAVAGDKERREEVIHKVSERINMTPEQVEEIMSVTIRVLANLSRSN